ncbi:hypothetical protein [Alcaligenes endophyticus]|uniref:Phage tail protein n=1 Tax=Alcaligenes endophyticus TaxID=1929088 RepID=A0ABT8EK96_9BURK|nr:hypothetical protein [Alcaligenes endophyticus]MCX5592014.1 hypothetical protein [Alcaligenes endophyticus]MDN4121704.1 hypothetical protein [Alcaligenes endophyticus]
MAWHDTGTVNVTLNNANVAGVNTNWLAGARPGDAFQGPDGRLYEVLNVASNTSITLTVPYRGPTATGQKYSLVPVHGYLKRSADILSSLAQDMGGFPTRLAAVESSRLVKGANLSDLTDVAAARQNLGLKGLAVMGTNDLGTAALVDVVGTMSGGAIIERGSNASGEYVRFADGTQICRILKNYTGLATATAYNNVFYRDLIWTFPAAFLTGSLPTVSGACRLGSSRNWLSESGSTHTNTTLTIWGAYDDERNGHVGVIAVGRWK